MIVPVVLNGWSASTRRKRTRTHTLVDRILGETGAPHVPVLGLKSMLLYARSRRVRKHIQRYERNDRVLLCVGKSLGARNMVERVLNKMEKLQYRSVYLVTIDPNWPESWDLSPNLNGHLLRLTHPVTLAVNVYFAAQKGTTKQAGALLSTPKGVPCRNWPVTDCDHFSIVQHPKVRQVLKGVIEEAKIILKADPL